MKTIASVALGALLATAVNASASTYSLTNSNGGDGYITGYYPTFTLYGADNSARQNFTDYSTVFTTAQSFKFSWTYTTNDCCGSVWDPAGYKVNGVIHQLSPADSDVGYSGSGVTMVTLAAGDTFGWYVYSQDSSLGRGLLEVSVTAVPEPETYAMLLAGLGVLGYAPRRRTGNYTQQKSRSV